MASTISAGLVQVENLTVNSSSSSGVSATTANVSNMSTTNMTVSNQLNLANNFNVAGTLSIAGMPVASEEDSLIAAREQYIQTLLNSMTLDEKLLMLSGGQELSPCWLDAYFANGCKRLNIPPMQFSDGPMGVRGSYFGNTNPPTCALPTGQAQAATWSKECGTLIGEILAKDLKKAGATTLLAPLVNSPRTCCDGRAYETLGEDPFLTGLMGAAISVAAQANGATVCLKHFVVNEQEFDRSFGNFILDERTLHEVSIKAFELPLRSGAKTLMGSYNCINNVPSTCNPILKDFVRNTLGFDGVVMTDWVMMDLKALYGYPLATLINDEALYGSVDIYMPDNLVISGFKSLILDGTIDESFLDIRIMRNLRLRYITNALMGKSQIPDSFDGVEPGPGTNFSDMTRRIAEEGICVLKNTGSVLPLSNIVNKKIAVVGVPAKQFVTAGGSSAVVQHSNFLENPLDFIQNYIEDVSGATFKYYPGVGIDSTTVGLGDGGVGGGALLNPFTFTRFENSRVLINKYHIHNIDDLPHWTAARAAWNHYQLTHDSSGANTDPSGNYTLTQRNIDIAAAYAQIPEERQYGPVDGVHQKLWTFDSTSINNPYLFDFSTSFADGEFENVLTLDGLMPDTSGGLGYDGGQTYDDVTGMYTPVINSYPTKEVYANKLWKSGYGFSIYGTYVAEETGTFVFQVSSPSNIVFYIADLSGNEAPEDHTYTDLDILADYRIGKHDTTNDNNNGYATYPSLNVRISLVKGQRYGIKILANCLSYGNMFTVSNGGSYKGLEGFNGFLGALLGASFAFGAPNAPSAGNNWQPVWANLMGSSTGQSYSGNNMLMGYTLPSLNIPNKQQSITAAVNGTSDVDYTIIFVGSGVFTTGEGSDRGTRSDGSFDPIAAYVYDSYTRDTSGYSGTCDSWQEELVNQIVAGKKAGSKVIVVSNTRGPYSVEKFIDGVDSFMWIGALGQSAGSSLVNTLFGVDGHYPSGKLSFPWPKSIRSFAPHDTSGGILTSSTDYSMWGAGGKGGNSHYFCNVFYKEGVYYGWRYITDRKGDSAYRFAFGYGLTYSPVSISNAVASFDGEMLTVTATATNTGSLETKEAFQLYMSNTGLTGPTAHDTTVQIGGSVLNCTNTEVWHANNFGVPTTSYDYIPTASMLGVPKRQLRDFAKTDELAPSASQTLTFTVDVRDLKYWDVSIHDWVLEPATYTFTIGRSCLDADQLATVTAVIA